MQHCRFAPLALAFQLVAWFLRTEALHATINSFAPRAPDEDGNVLSNVSPTHPSYSTPGYLSGERDYEKLRGGTGPLVYPAGFLYVFAWLRWLCGGDGSNVGKAQLIFAALYLANRATVMATYYLALGASGVENVRSWRYAVTVVALR